MSAELTYFEPAHRFPQQRSNRVRHAFRKPMGFLHTSARATGFAVKREILRKPHVIPLRPLSRRH